MRPSLLRRLGGPALLLLVAACSAPGITPGMTPGTATTGNGAGPVAAAAVRIEGAVERPAGYDLAALRARPAITQADTFDSGHGRQTHAFTGTALWPLIVEAGSQRAKGGGNGNGNGGGGGGGGAAAAGGGAMGAGLDRYLLAIGADGYQAVFSIGELDPAFGGRASLIAYAEDDHGTQQPTAGGLRLTAPGDAKGGRYVGALARLELRAAPMPPSNAAKPAGGIAQAFTVSGQVRGARSFDLASLRALPSTTVTVGANVYQGVGLWTLLDALGLVAPAGLKNPMLSMLVVATGSDGYRALLSLGEIDPAYGGKGAIVAYARNGEPLGRNGMARLVVPGEVKQGRSVSNLAAIEVLSAAAP